MHISRAILAVTGAWTTDDTKVMSASRSSLASFVRSDDRIVAIGGETAVCGGTALASTEIYDPALVAHGHQ
jgi:hypothetical protein